MSTLTTATTAAPRWMLPLLLSLLALGAGPASAGIIQFELDRDQGGVTVTDPTTIMTIEEEGPGAKFTIQILSNPSSTGDLFGVFGHIADDALLAGMRVASSSVEVTASQFAADSVTDLGRGNSFRGGSASPAPFDFGLTLGRPGAAGGLVKEVTFTLVSDLGPLPLSTWADQSFGVRIQSVGALPSGGSGSLKLWGTAEPLVPTTGGEEDGGSVIGGSVAQVPEPAPMTVLALGLSSLLLRRGRRGSSATRNG